MDALNLILFFILEHPIWSLIIALTLYALIILIEAFVNAPVIEFEEDYFKNQPKCPKD